MNKDILFKIALVLPIRALYNLLLVDSLPRPDYFWQLRLHQDFNMMKRANHIDYYKLNYFYHQGETRLLSDSTDHPKKGDILLSPLSYYDGKEFSNIYTSFFYHQRLRLVEEYPIHYWKPLTSDYPKLTFYFDPMPYFMQITKNQRKLNPDECMSYFVDWRGNTIILVYNLWINKYQKEWSLTNQSYSVTVDIALLALFFTFKFHGVLYRQNNSIYI